jgi:hypothetical protein
VNFLFAIKLSSIALAKTGTIVPCCKSNQNCSIGLLRIDSNVTLKTANKSSESIEDTGNCFSL